jgi:hypothetical protein
MSLPAVLARGQAITHDGLISEDSIGEGSISALPGQHSSAGRFFLGNERIQEESGWVGGAALFQELSNFEHRQIWEGCSFACKKRRSGLKGRFALMARPDAYCQPTPVRPARHLSSAITGSRPTASLVELRATHVMQGSPSRTLSLALRSS